MSLPKIISSLIVTAVAGCNLSEVAVKPDTPKIVQPTIEEENRLKAQADLERRAEDFSPVIAEEIEQSELTVELETTNSILTCSYLPNKIIIRCTLDYTRCQTDSLEHELGHHIYPSLSKESKEKLAEAIDERLQMPDAESFRQLQIKMEKTAEIFSQVGEQIHDLSLCKEFLALDKYDREFTAILQELGVDFNSDAVKATRDAYKKMFPNCTKEKYTAAAKIVKTSVDAGECAKEEAKIIYHQSSKISPACPKVEPIDNPLARGKLFDLTRYQQTKKEYMDLLSSMVDNITSQNNEEISPALAERIDRALVSYVDLLIIYGNISSGLALGAQTTFNLYHDSQMEEQFAAVIDSLVDGYRGPITTAPMRLRLNEPVLQNLEQLEYKRQKILAPLVERYRQQLREEVK
ncbi:hypothetical protein J4417_00235 [Candidatus Woesearchaeota archaeon]|nr:hypothetical protein [Candidatus Woesearchaeota archaeon]